MLHVALGRQVDHKRVDREIGARIRARRVGLSLSQFDLAQGIGVSYQQVQKYEHGKNRVSASTLVAIANALHLKPCALIDGLGAWDGTP